ncbi:MAG: hypothetical protein IT355_11525 [Gemmatimonadaceae bacterium]|nr:hypothetical protein [Gemmatimonadaceae bacterium]
MTDTASHADWILGTWQLLRCEPPLDIEPGTRMQFEHPHRLAYSIPTANGPLHVILRWAVHGSTLHTAHEDGSNPVQVAVTRGDADVLTYDFGGPRAWFVRTT